MKSIRKLGTLIGKGIGVIGGVLGISKPCAPAGNSAENPDLPRRTQPAAPSMESEREPDLESGQDSGQLEVSTSAASSSDDGVSKPPAPVGNSAENPDLPRLHPSQPAAPSMESEGEPDLESESGQDSGEQEASTSAASSSDDGETCYHLIYNFLQLVSFFLLLFVSLCCIVLKLACDFVNDVLQIELAGIMTSRNRTVKGNLMVGFALMNASSTSLFAADSLSRALFVCLTVLGLGTSLCLSYKGDDLQGKDQKTLLLVSTTALLGALSMLGVGAALHAEFF